MLRLRSLLAAALVLLLSFRAFASDGAILLLVHGDDLPRERVREAIERELGRKVVWHGDNTGVVTVTYRKAEGELAVTWDGEKRTVSRVITARPATDDVIVDAALLAGNLARDEAEELVPPKAPPLTSAEVVPPREKKDLDATDVNFGSFYPLAMNFGRPWVRTRFDFNIIYGRVGQLDGVQIGGVNIVDRVPGKSTGDTNGVQIGYLLNITRGSFAGAQLGAFGNVASNAMDGWQAAPLFNYAGAVRGAQVAAVNVGGDVQGLQIGLVNVGRKVEGSMVGLVNVADDVDGAPIGLASVTKSGGVHPTTWFSTTTFGNVGIRLATKHTYTMPMVNYHYAYDRDFVGGGFVIGARIPIDEKRYTDIDIGGACLVAPRTKQLPGDAETYNELLFQPKLRAMFGWRFADHFGLFAGVGLLTQIRVEQQGELVTLRVGPDFFAGFEL
jgi:hypothetical protein